MMKIAIIQGSTQTEKNKLLYETSLRVLKQHHHELINFGVKADELIDYSYTEIAVLIALLINSQTIDFVITGCSSGQGMNMACNSLPGVLSGFLQTPQDAYLFGRINDGNVASFSLGLGFGWLGELNLEYMLEKLFDGDFGIGYPEEVAARKVTETNRVKTLNALSKRPIIELLDCLDEAFIQKLLTKEDVINYIIEHSRERDLVAWLKDRSRQLRRSD